MRVFEVFIRTRNSKGKTRGLVPFKPRDIPVPRRVPLSQQIARKRA